MATRKTISPKLKAEILFASDNSCCVCHSRDLGLQIAHIDNDPSNNDFDNLAVLCLQHHHQSHQSGGLGAAFSPELVTLYNMAWRAQVRSRLLPHEESHTIAAYRISVWFDLYETILRWGDKLAYHLLGMPLRTGPETGEFKLDYLVSRCEFPYSRELFDRLLPVARGEMRVVSKQIDRIQMLHSDVMPIPLKILLIDFSRALLTFYHSYLEFRAFQAPASLEVPPYPISFSRVISPGQRVCVELKRMIFETRQAYANDPNFSLAIRPAPLLLSVRD
ncbi:MAG TPA: HNH endonuclease signature motif containing protein [Capsulimonadaceae bacterium]